MGAVLGLSVLAGNLGRSFLFALVGWPVVGIPAAWVLPFLDALFPVRGVFAELVYGVVGLYVVVWTISVVALFNWALWRCCSCFSEWYRLNRLQH